MWRPGLGPFPERSLDMPDPPPDYDTADEIRGVAENLADVRSELDQLAATLREQGADYAAQLVDVAGERVREAEKEAERYADDVAPPRREEDEP